MRSSPTPSAAFSATTTDRPRVVIAGFGLVTPLGFTAWDTFAALLQGRSIADRTGRYGSEGVLRSEKLPGAVALVRETGCVAIAQHEPTDPAVAIAERAAREAAFMARAPLAGLPTYLGTSKGAAATLDRETRQWRMADGGWRMGRAGYPTSAFSFQPSAFPLGPHGYLTHELVRRLGIAPRAHHVAACASSLIALDRARRELLNRPDAETHHPSSIIHHPSPATALVLTAEAALLPVFIHSYRRLGVLAEPTPAGYRQRPLDARRSGFMLAELGAAVVLRRLDPGQPAPPGSIELVDTATAMEAHDMVRTAPGMPALRRVAETLLRVLPGGGGLGLLHPHAPGTVDHDPAELAVLREVLGGSGDVYAVKGAVGHGLGAAGLVSLVVACLCLKTGRRPPMPWLTEPMAQAHDWELSPSAGTVDRSRPQAVFATGFGGHTAGALIRMADGC